MDTYPTWGSLENHRPKMDFSGDMLVPRRVFFFVVLLEWFFSCWFWCFLLLCFFAQDDCAIIWVPSLRISMFCAYFCVTIPWVSSIFPMILWWFEAFCMVWQGAIFSEPKGDSKPHPDQSTQCLFMLFLVEFHLRFSPRKPNGYLDTQQWPPFHWSRRYTIFLKPWLVSGFNPSEKY